MNETLNEKIVYRGEMSRELTIDEVDSNFKKVANPWNPNRRYGKQDIVYEIHNSDEGEVCEWFMYYNASDSGLSTIGVRPSEYENTPNDMWYSIGGSGGSSSGGGGNIKRIPITINNFPVSVPKGVDIKDAFESSIGCGALIDYVDSNPKKNVAIDLTATNIQNNQPRLYMPLMADLVLGNVRKLGFLSYYNYNGDVSTIDNGSLVYILCQLDVTMNTYTSVSLFRLNAKGDKGATGATGATGAQGPKGEDGFSAVPARNQQKYLYIGYKDIVINFENVRQWFERNHQGIILTFGIKETDEPDFLFTKNWKDSYGTLVQMPVYVEPIENRLVSYFNFFQKPKVFNDSSYTTVDNLLIPLRDNDYTIFDGVEFMMRVNMYWYLDMRSGREAIDPVAFFTIELFNKCEMEIR